MSDFCFQTDNLLNSLNLVKITSYNLKPFYLCIEIINILAIVLSRGESVEIYEDNNITYDEFMFNN